MQHGRLPPLTQLLALLLLLLLLQWLVLHPSLTWLLCLAC
jgi:hypothetical protein